MSKKLEAKNENICICSDHSHFLYKIDNNNNIYTHQVQWVDQNERVSQPSLEARACLIKLLSNYRYFPSDFKPQKREGKREPRDID